MTLTRFVLFLVTIAFVAYVGLPTYFHLQGIQPDISQFECPPGGPLDPDEKRNQAKYGIDSPAIKIIELVDSGEFVKRCQLTDALYELTEVKREKFIVMYVHGWKHNASNEDTDRREFKKLMTQLRDSAPKRHVVGIFIGWNASTNPKWLENLTFWGRKRAADRISQSATLTKLIGKIDSIRRGQAAKRQRNGGDGKLDTFIAMGHSFGARMLYAATSQILLYRTQLAYGRPYELVRGPADMIVLVNPAMEASAFAAMDGLRRAKEEFRDEQPPLLVSISTSGDDATKFAFPIGQFAGLARAPSELTTIGHYPSYATHELIRSDEVPSADGGFSMNFCSAGICLRELEQPELRTQGNNPFYIVNDVPKNILKNHSDIWVQPFIGWLADMFKTIDADRTNQIDAPTR